MTRIVIAGSRNYEEYPEVERFIEQCVSELEPPFVILSGGCRGADRIGEKYADERDIPVERYPPAWHVYGKGAGPKRNRMMVDACDVIICFWNGESRGTKSLIEYAHKKGKAIYIKRIEMSDVPGKT